jgi:hypothetical protein
MHHVSKWRQQKRHHILACILGHLIGAHEPSLNMHPIMNQWRQLKKKKKRRYISARMPDIFISIFIPRHILWRRPTAGRLTAGFGGALNSSAMDLNIWLKNEPTPISAAAFRVSNTCRIHLEAD